MERKVAFGGGAGALAFVVMAIIGMVWPETAAEIPTGMESALTTIFMTVTGYVTKSTPSNDAAG